MVAPLHTLLTPFGAPEATVIPLTSQAALDPRARLDYLDLLRPRQGADMPDGVVRIDSTTVAYVLRGTNRDIDLQRVRRLRRLVAQRDDAPFLVVATPGRLAIHGVGLDRLAAERTLLDEVVATEARAQATFRRLHQEPSAPEQARQRAIHELLYGLLTKSIDGLHELHGVSRSDAIALSGRALFMRFLLDRGVIGGKRKSPGEICPGADDWESIFSTTTRVQATCRWIDRTFNGDFLPVSLLASGERLRHLPRDALELLEAIMRRSSQSAMEFEQRDLGLETPFQWGELDFAHIPVGILSQVYERQAERWDPMRRRNDSVFYTPRRIAEYMTREAFARLERQLGEPPCHARVLDPAVGGGVFLVAAFRELAAAWLSRSGRWPSTRQLRRILFEQLTGFDIQDIALSLTSLSLYLCAIELDHPPFRFEDLRFEQPLRGHVLFDVREGGVPEGGTCVGSLGAMVGAGHRGRYDVVIGNPPWTSLPGEEGRRVITTAARQVRATISARLGEERATVFEFPDNVPDLPFVWRSMEWARHAGVLAFALDGRWLFKTTPRGRQARADLLDAVTTWGVLNGADLRLTPVWPEISRPFCLFFADNAAPPADHAFPMLSPYFEPSLNDSGRLRVDPDAVQPIAPTRLSETPALLKALFRGTPLDVRLLQRLERLGLPSFAQWWESLGLAHGQGFQTSSTAMDARHLLGRPMLRSDAQLGIVVNIDALPTFAYRRLHRTRDEAIYKGPLLLLRESMTTDGRWVHVSDEGVVFTRTFYGYSAHGHGEGRLLVRYLCLLLRSSLFEWFNLITGSKLGVEREVWHKVDVDAFPVVPLGDVEGAHRAQIEPLFEALAAGALERRALTSWVASVYRLGPDAAEVIEDTLATGLPHHANRQFAATAPDEGTVAAFAERLRAELSHYADVNVVVVPAVPGDPFRVLVVGPELPHLDGPQADGVRRLLEKIDREGVSELVLSDPATRRVWLARLSQHRYWTQSRARLAAARLVAEHLDLWERD